MSCSDGTTSAPYTYDDMGRKLTETVNYGSFSKSFSYTYYGNGLKHTFTAPDSTVYTYLYGLNNELQEIQIPGVGSMTISAYTWNRPATINYPGGTQRSYTYDALMRLQSLTVLAPNSNSILDYSYTYDNVGNIEIKDTEHGAYTYGYDDSSRLLTADNPVLTDESYTYDNVGNRLTSADVSGSWTYNFNNELLGYADVAYDYDANGNMTQKRVGTAAVNYIYDAANRLVKVEDDATQTVIVEYSYDPFGRRLWKEVGGVRTYFFYSEEGLIAEYDENGVEIRSYGYKPDSTWTTDPLWLKEDGSYYWYQNDHLGTPQKLTAQDGTVVWSAQYSSFGEADVQVETITNNLRLPGQYHDEETGLHYNFHRYYDPKSRRYVRVDPIGFADRANLYTYVTNNPVNFIDPIGLIKRVGIAIPNGTKNQNDLFRNIVKRSADKWEDKESGQEILNYLVEMSKDDCPIELLTIAGHGWGYRTRGCEGGPGIPGVKPDTGLYLDSYFDLFRFSLPYFGSYSVRWRPSVRKFWHPEAATINDLKGKVVKGEIKFAESCTIQVHSCRISDSFTRELARATTCRVVVAASSCFLPGKDYTKWESGPGTYDELKTCPSTGFYEIIPCSTGGTIRRNLSPIYQPCTRVPCNSPRSGEPCGDICLQGDICVLN